MNKKIKLSLLGTLIAGSALAVTLPIVSCSASTDVVLTGTVNANAAVAYRAYVLAAATKEEQQVLVTKGHKVPAGADFDKLVAAITFKDDADVDATFVSADVIESFEVTTATTIETAGTIPTGAIVTVNLKSGFSSDTPIIITVGTTTKA